MHDLRARLRVWFARCRKIQVKFFEFLDANYPAVMDGASPDELGDIVFKKVVDKQPLLCVLERSRDFHVAGFLSMFATSDEQKRQEFLGMSVSERNGFLGVSTVHLRNARTAVSQIYEQNGASLL